jgi:hypothetical protein
LGMNRYFLFFNSQNYFTSWKHACAACRGKRCTQDTFIAVPRQYWINMSLCIFRARIVLYNVCNNNKYTKALY